MSRLALSRLARTIALVLLAVGPFGIGGCRQQTANRGRTGATIGKRTEGDALLASVAETLNDLAARNDLNLAPTQPLLTAANSSNGEEVQATITVNPASPETGVNYLRATTGNANFRSLGVKPLDVVRIFFVKGGDTEEETQQMQEMGIQERTSIEAPIRRLDLQDPENALILAVPLQQPAEYPERIEIWRYSDKRMEQISDDLRRYASLREPPLGWEPTADKGSLALLVERANQWLRNTSDTAAAWEPTKLLAALPKDVREAKGVSAAIAPERLRNGLFGDESAGDEGRLLQQAVWTRDIAAWARGGAVSDADAAAALFAWVVRNIQLDDATRARSIHFPWQALAYGHGSADHRAWVFVELCRQLRIPAVMLVFAPAADGPVKHTLAAVRCDDQWQLFDAEYGLPLPGKSGPASLAELRDDPDLVRAFDLPNAPYPLTAGDVTHVAAQIVASPLQLSQRAARLEAALKGEQLVFLAVDVPATVDQLKSAGVDSTTLWPVPFAAIADSYATRPSTRTAEVAQFAPFAQLPELWKARTLHFMGFKDVPRDRRDDPLATPTDGHALATPLYQHERVLASEAELAALDPAKRTVALAAKQDASYWLGLLSFDKGSTSAALWWLEKRILAGAPQNPWREGARYNAARVHERIAEDVVGDAAAADQALAAAIKLLEQTPRTAPQWAGNQVLAGLLKEKLKD